jgi:predicted lipoprotein
MVMQKKIFKYLIIVSVLLLTVYNSVYFKKLDEVKAAAPKDFNAESYARNYLKTKLNPSINNLTGIDTLSALIKANKAGAFKSYAHALDIGNIGYFMAKGQGVVTAKDESDVTILTPGRQTIKIATEYVFGNALRDAPGLIKVKDFTSTTNLNSISSEVNKIIRAEVLPPFKSKVKKGDKVTFAGAFELNSEHLNLDNIEIIPLYLQIK